MNSSFSQYQLLGIRLFVILITFLFLSACVSPPYHQKNTRQQSQYRPATHTISAGDTLFSIAWRYGLKYEELAKYNKISKPYKIYPGQVIRLDLPKAGVGSASSGALSGRSASSKPGSTYSKNNSSKNQSNTSLKTPKSLPSNGALVWHWPAKGTILKRFSGANTLDKGIDISGKLGEPVLAAASGQVVYSGSGLRGYGKLLIIRHNDSFLSAYAHNEKLLVKEGDSVKAGQRIADMGSSGTDKVKLHFEIRREGTPEDPLKYLPKR
jgi:lipoprotein NlpD